MLAVNHGVALARKFRAKLTLLYVVESPTALLYTFPSGAEKIEAQRKEQAEKMLPALVSPEDQDDLDVVFVVKTGEIERMIKAVADEEHADVVVMGTHGRGLFGRLFIGSIAQELLRKLHLPVLTVCRVSRPFTFKRILYGTDLGPDSERGLQFVFDMAAVTEASVVIAHTMDKRPHVTYEMPEVRELFDQEQRDSLARARRKFAEFEAEGERRNIPVECVLSEGEASQALVRIADETDADFIVLGLRKMGAVARALLGTVAEPVICAAHVPVLSVPIDLTEQKDGESKTTKAVHHVQV
jgi:nucleotide-binding universal stress UspA family protein